MKRWYAVIAKLVPFLDFLLFAFVYPSALLLKFVRRGGLQRMPICRRVLLSIGVIPVRNHYYEPFFDPDRLRPSHEIRPLPGIDWNLEGQLRVLSSFDYSSEIRSVFARWEGVPAFHFHNDAFEPGDAEFWYSIIRWRKPRTIIEVGSGYSSLLAARAIEINRADDPQYSCRHVCIEPFEAPWLESVATTVLRQRVEEVPRDQLTSLVAGDILFIDSSHVIRPGGDVVTEILEILPALSSGVLVHFHDIFSPRDYLDHWRKERVLFWNEQYLLEAFLSQNREWTIMAALNYLHHQHYEQLKAICPFLSPTQEPGSFYIQRL